MVNPLPSASLVVRSPWKPQWNLREREGEMRWRQGVLLPYTRSVRQGWFEHDSLPTTSWETGRSILKGIRKKGGNFSFSFCHDKHPQSLSKGWGLVDQSLKTIKLPYTGRFFVCLLSPFLGPFVFLLELSKSELISGTLWEQQEFIQSSTITDSPWHHFSPLALHDVATELAYLSSGTC